MLDMGFAPQLAVILKSVPQERQTMLFSATWDPALHDIARKHLVNPARISVGEVSRAASTVTQKIVQTTVKDKNETLLDEINKRPQGSMLIFARTQARTDRLAKYLLSYGLDVGLIHGGRSQGQRNSALAGFKNGNTRILVATALPPAGSTSRTSPMSSTTISQWRRKIMFTSGRTGRAGTVGQALSLLVAEDRSLWNGIVRLLKMTGSALPEGVTATIRVMAKPKFLGCLLKCQPVISPVYPRLGRGGQGGGAPLANPPVGPLEPAQSVWRPSQGQQPRPAQNYAASSAISSEVEALPWRPKYRVYVRIDRRLSSSIPRFSAGFAGSRDVDGAGFGVNR